MTAPEVARAKRMGWVIPVSWVLVLTVAAIQVLNAAGLFANEKYRALTLTDKLFFGSGASYCALALVSLGTALWLVRARPGWMTFSLLLAMLNNADSYNRDWALPAVLDSALSYAGMVLTYNGLAPLLIVFALRFPNDRCDSRRRLAQWSAVLATVAAEIFVLYVASMRASTGARVPFEALYNYLSGASALVAAAVLFARLAGVEARMRVQLRWATIGCIVGFTAVFAGLVLVALSPTPGGAGALTRSQWFTPFFTYASLIELGAIMIPACAAYALVRTRYADPLFVLNRATVLTLTAGILAVVIGGADWIIGHYLSETGVALALQVALTVGLGFVLNKVHRAVEESVERVLFRKRYDASQYLEHLGRSLALATQETVVEEAVTVDAARELGLASAALFRYSTQRDTYVRGVSTSWGARDAREIELDDPLIRFLRLKRKPMRPQEARWARSDVPAGTEMPVLAIPMLVRGEVAGVALYGAHTDHTEIDSSEEQDLVELMERACAALDHVEATTLRQALALAGGHA